MLSSPVPWYKEHAKYMTLARQYIQASVRRRDELAVENEFRNYLGFSRAQLIFESNRMENVRTPIGVTKRLIDEFLPPLPATYPAYRNTNEQEDALLESLRRSFDALRSKYDMGHYAKYIPVQMAGETGGVARSFMEVVYHAHSATSQAQ